jgi:LemA protein
VDSTASVVDASAAAARAAAGDKEDDGMTTIARRALGGLIGAVLLSGCGYNQLVSLQQGIQASWAQVQNQLQRRNDLIPNLVNTVKGYATHESQVFEEVANARSRLLAAGTRDQQIEAAQGLQTALGRLLAIAEQYPQLKANEQFNRLMDELSGTENRIAVERMRYNDAVRAYNTYRNSIPTVLYASWIGFKEEKYFEAPPEAQQVPKVDFGTPTTLAPK